MKKLISIIIVCIISIMNIPLPVLGNSVPEKNDDEEIVTYCLESKKETIISSSNFSLESFSYDTTQISSSAYTPPSKNYGDNYSSSTSSARSVIGEDTRSPVDDVSVSPYCKIVFIRTYFPNLDQPVRSTGVILGPDLILTCAHALYVESYGGWATECRIYTEVDGRRPRDNRYACRAVDMTIPTAWRTEGSDGSDWGFVIVDENIGAEQGWMGFGYSPTDMTADYRISGYPLNGPEETDSSNYTMYTSLGKINLNADGTMYTYAIDTSEGQSGSPLYTSAQIVYGIHVLGTTTSAPTNKATKISPSLYNYLVTAKQEGIERWG